MIGNPKFKRDEAVFFEFNNEWLPGVVYIVDSFGTFFYTEDVSYDILGARDGHNILFKHIPEKYVKECPNEYDEEIKMILYRDQRAYYIAMLHCLKDKDPIIVSTNRFRAEYLLPCIEAIDEGTWEGIVEDLLKLDQEDDDMKYIATILKTIGVDDFEEATSKLKEYFENDDEQRLLKYINE